MVGLLKLEGSWLLLFWTNVFPLVTTHGKCEQETLLINRAVQRLGPAVYKEAGGDLHEYLQQNLPETVKAVRREMKLEPWKFN